MIVLKATLAISVIAVGWFGIVATSQEPKKPKGEFLKFGAEPSVVCVNFGVPVVRVSFTAKSDNKQCVDILINDEPVVAAISDINQNRCGRDEWGETYTFSLRDIFGNNIPPSIRITGKLFTGGLSTTAQQTLLDSTSTVITTRICEPPGTIGN